MPTASPWMLKMYLRAAVHHAFFQMPRTVQQVALFIWGIWQLVGELIHLIDVVTSYPYPARNDRS